MPIKEKVVKKRKVGKHDGIIQRVKTTYQPPFTDEESKRFKEAMSTTTIESFIDSTETAVKQLLKKAGLPTDIEVTRKTQFSEISILGELAGNAEISKEHYAALVLYRIEGLKAGLKNNDIKHAVKNALDLVDNYWKLRFLEWESDIVYGRRSSTGMKNSANSRGVSEQEKKQYQEKVNELYTSNSKWSYEDIKKIAAKELKVSIYKIKRYTKHPKNFVKRTKDKV